ncbi:hypothetical protein ZTR_08486 [Talaromyces verruculosus]|nr:hypothetical protein ZTR_08486 [Talaromyces verruculosus]
MEPLTDDEQAVRDIRKLLVDICRQNGGGHGGSAIGMAPLAVALWKKTMRYNPANANWFDRDKLVLSNGHSAMLLYTMLHIIGYPHMTMEELKLYANAKMPDPVTKMWKATICHGHPEIEIPGVEATTGPLGQGIANAVGLAIASKKHAALFNKPRYEVTLSRIYCITGDGCLQEGVAQEALAIAGHLGLDNLIVCYDNNGVTCDGPLDWIVSDDTNAKLRAMELAKSHKKQPTFINIKTTIGYGTSTAGTFKSHHGTYSDEDATLLDETLDGIEDFLLSMNIGDKGVSQATRQYNGAIFNQMMERVPNLMAGGADLWNSNQMGDQGHRIFDRNHYNGRVIRYGIREHAMASISNGIAAYAPGALIPVTATIFMFYLYAAPGVRMGALNNLQVIHVATHDSIGEGQNGPTHQPVELDSLYRTMPNLQYIRPATGEEVVR